MSEHSHSHDDNLAARRLISAAILAGIYLVAEVVGGVYTGSLALLADAGHMLGDVAALGVALLAMWFASRPPSVRRTFGNARAEVLGAALNGLALIIIAGFIAREAFERWSHPPTVMAGPMLAVAVGGLVVNLATLKILHGGHQDDLNLRGAFLHVMADTLGSIGAIVSGILMLVFDWNWVDPIASLLIASIVVFSSVSLLRQAGAVLMQTAPAHVDVEALSGALGAPEAVTGVHAMRVWSLKPGTHFLSAHLVVDADASWPNTLRVLTDRLRTEFGLTNITLQLEPQEVLPAGTPPSPRPCRFSAPPVEA